MDLTPILEFSEAAGYPLTSRQISLLQQFHTVLYESNQVMNLTRIPEEEAVVKHYLDSLLLSQFIPTGARVLDIGTGPGIPAWPLAWFRRDITVVAMDGSNKGLAFLRTQPLPNLTIVQVRAEESSQRETFDVVTGRALAPLPLQLELAAAFASKKGVVIPFRTPGEREIASEFPAATLGLELADLKEVALPGSEIVRLFPIYVKTRRTPAEYPRPWGKMKVSPIGTITSKKG